MAWTVAILAVGVPAIATVVPGLPNDQYHFFLDPAVFTLAGLGVAALWQRARGLPWVEARSGGAPVILAAGAFALLVLISIARWPVAVDADGGWPAMRAAGERIVAAAAGEPVSVLSAPALKMSDATDFAILYAGGTVAEVDRAQTVVVTCDRLFASVISGSCGGAAEDALARDAGYTGPPAERFDVSSRIAVSIYRR
jgi:hypothetical protein